MDKVKYLLLDLSYHLGGNLLFMIVPILYSLSFNINSFLKFLSFILIYSIIYPINDLIDYEKDKKRKYLLSFDKPLAAGLIDLRTYAICASIYITFASFAGLLFLQKEYLILSYLVVFIGIIRSFIYNIFIRSILHFIMRFIYFYLLFEFFNIYDLLLIFLLSFFYVSYVHCYKIRFKDERKSIILSKCLFLSSLFIIVLAPYNLLFKVFLLGLSLHAFIWIIRYPNIVIFSNKRF